MNKKVLRVILCATVVTAVILSSTACGELSGTYTSETGFYNVEFKAFGKCLWTQADKYFEGTYEKTDEGYDILIEGSGLYSNTLFKAVEESGDLIITGGAVYGERFVKK